MPPTLRPYQTRALDALRERIAAGKRRLLLVAPCGSGKTVMAAEIIRSFRERSRGPALLIVHRRELVDQSLAKLSAVGIQAGVLMGDDHRTDASASVQVASIQTLHRRRDHLPAAGLVIADEAHHCVSASFRDVLALYPQAFVIGLTATPWRSDKLGLADIFEDLVVAATHAELEATGALVPCEAYAYNAPDLHAVPLTAGDFNQRELGLACNTSVLVGSVVDEYRTHTPGKRAIVFPVNVEHSQALVAQFTAAGFTARHIDWSTPAVERSAATGDFKSGQVQVLSSVGVLTEGFDAPAAEVCVLARPTKSLSLYLQMAGRVLRPSDGKTRGILSDHAGNVFRHGFPDDPRDYALTTTSQRVVDLQSCTDCGYMVSRWPTDGLCPRCGSLQHVPAEVREAADRRRGKEHVTGERLDRHAIEEIRALFSSRGLRELTVAQAARVAAATRVDRAAEFLRLKAVCERKGFQPGWVSHAYRATFGRWPVFRPADLDGVTPATKPFLPLPPRSANAA